MNVETKNARISSTMLGVEDHGIMSAYLHLEYDGGGQGFGGYGLDTYSKEKKERVAHACCGFFIKRVLETVGVEKWEDLPGKYIRVKADWGKVHEIGNVIKNKWFNPEKEFKQFEEKEEE
jgi:hypothetical protein